ncbi:MAG: AraC family transcriptional regulator [Clostridiales bacterium]|nr:AraC family transcriptional regulator [Clostridiales bacterium]
MKLDILADKLGLSHICGSLDKEAENVYVGDLLSWVMSHAVEGDVWVTIMSNVNVAAVASLTEAACVILAEGVEPDPETVQAAEEKDVTIFSDKRSAYQLCCCLGALLSNG